MSKKHPFGKNPVKKKPSPQKTQKVKMMSKTASTKPFVKTNPSPQKTRLAKTMSKAVSTKPPIKTKPSPQKTRLAKIMSKSPPTKPPVKTNPSPRSWDQEVDIVVMGSGAAGLTAGLVAALLGKSVLLLEKSSRFGGTTAISGGGVWIPCPDLDQTTDDSPEKALAYLKDIVGEFYQKERAEAYVNNAWRILETLKEKSLVRFQKCHAYPDYYPDKKGALEEGRTWQPVPFYRGKLAQKERSKMVEPVPWSLMMRKISMTMEDATYFVTHKKGWMLRAAALTLRYWLDIGARFRSGKDRRATLGSALINRLYLSLIKSKNATLCHDAPVNALFTEGQSHSARVVGLAYKYRGKTMHVKARHGVILAAGGFDHHLPMREKYLPKPTSIAWSAAHHDNTGDAIQIAQEIGASLTLMDKAWWTPVYLLEGKLPVPMFADRASPGCLIVTKKGKRFVNEAAPYIDVGKAMYHHHLDEAYVIVDERRRERFTCGPMMPKKIQPRLPKLVRELVKIGNTLDELATKLGIDRHELAKTVHRFNKNAKAGKDPDFFVGDNAYDRHFGSAEPADRLNPCLGTVAKAPFYGFPIKPGDIGTNGGIATNADGQALRPDGTPIKGLYAAGNCAATMMGDTYPGAGATIGPAMIFAALSVEKALGKKLS